MSLINTVTPPKEHEHTQESQQQYAAENIEAKDEQALAHTSYDSFNPQMSVTEQHILSHHLIKDIVERSKKKTVQHFVNLIPPHAKLYTTPQENQEDEFKFDTIPPKNKEFISTASRKVGEINRRLSQSKRLANRLSELAQNNRQSKANSQRTMSAENVNKRVSISGLVTYNFNSVNARRSLGSIPKEPQEISMSKKIENSKRITSKSLDREARIIKRRPNVDNLHRAEISSATVCDFHMPTDKFLKMIRKESQKDEKIYGEKFQKLTCIKEYMQAERTDFEHSKFIVQSVLSSQKKKLQTCTKIKGKKVDDDQELAKRKQVCKKKKIMMKHLFFTQL